jgi:hypothetical protein
MTQNRLFKKNCRKLKKQPIDIPELTKKKGVIDTKWLKMQHEFAAHHRMVICT